MRYCEWLLAGALGVIIAVVLMRCFPRSEGYAAVSARGAVMGDGVQRSFVVENHATLALDRMSVDAVHAKFMKDVDHKISVLREEATQARQAKLREANEAATEVAEAKRRAYEEKCRAIVDDIGKKYVKFDDPIHIHIKHHNRRIGGGGDSQIKHEHYHGGSHWNTFYLRKK
tara:strand:- start:59 stop:574 length:516 start_codon:yes stop_codon:yes gene_type:complete